jgi:Flp pilus assembly pilin Flp
VFKHNHSPLPTKSQQTGQGFVEYAIILLLVGIAVVVILSLLRPAIEDAFERFITNAPVAPPEIGPIGGQFTPRPGPTVAFASANFASSEAVSVATIIVSLSYAFDNPITVRVSTADDTGPYPATAGVDYEATSTTITFAPNETVKQVPITMINDGDTEEDETVLLRLDNASTPNVGDPAILTIQDDDVPPIFSFTVSTQVTEENLGSVDVVVTMDRIYNNAAAVDYTTQSGAPGDYVATPGGSCSGAADYATTSGTLNFPSGTISDTISITLCDDGLVENTEVFQVLLSNPVAGGNPTAIGGTNPMSVNIIDDETPPNIQFAAAAYEVDEAGPNAELVVQLSRTYATEVRVDYATSNGPIGPTGAQAGSDYTQSNGFAIIPSGDITTTIYIPITDDGNNEEPETFNVTLSSPNPGIIPIVAPNPSVVTIIDNDCGYGPYNIPADRIEAEHFLCDGEGVSYHDTDSVNSGGYPGRFDAPGVDLRENFTGSTSNNVDLGWTVAGEWLNYSINATQTEYYDITVRASAAVNNASFRLLVDGVQIGNVIQVPNTGNINTYQNLSIPAVLVTQGAHTLRLEIVNGGANYDYIQMQLAAGPLVQFSAPTYVVSENGTNALITVNLSFATAVDVTVNYATSNGTATAGSDYNVTSGPLTIPATQLSGTFNVPIINDGAIEAPAETVNLTLSNPVNGQPGPQSTAVLYIIDDECSFGPYTVPSRVEAENFQCGGQGTAYNDTTTGNSGSSSYRFWESADLSSGGTGNYVDATINGEWLRYNINVPSAGYYNVGIRAAANVSNADFSLQVEGSALYGPFDVPNTGSPTSFTTVMVSGIYLTAGQHTIRLNIIGNGATYDYLEFSTLAGLLLTLSDDNNTITWPASGGTTISDVDREDIVLFSNNSYSLFFDGSDVGLAGINLQGFQLMSDGTILMTFANLVTVNGNTYNPEDIARFTPTSLGANTSGTFSMYFDGSNNGLSGDIDGFFVQSTGLIFISTSGSVTVPQSPSGTLNANDEDIIIFTPATGRYTWHMDAGDVGLDNGGSEDIDAFWVASSGAIYFSTVGNFTVTGLSGRGNDVGIFNLTTPGSTTAGTFVSTLFFDGNNNGLTNELIAGFYVIP